MIRSVKRRSAMKLLKDVFVVGGGEYGIGLSHGLDCNVYLIDCGDQAALIDAGAGKETDRIVANAEGEGIPRRKIRTLVLTHTHLDHSGGAKYLKETCGARLYVSALEAGALERGDEEAISLPQAKKSGIYPPDATFPAVTVECKVTGGETFTAGKYTFTLIATPGHSRGSLSVLVEGGEKRMLFSGDAVFLRGLLALQNIPDCSITDYKVGMSRLGGLSIDCLFPGHFGFTINYGQKHIDMAIDALSSLSYPKSII
jgi:glyoxylase-like metal-dependent hydrolase (beta-lactamase superfamily II)